MQAVSAVLLVERVIPTCTDREVVRRGWEMTAAVNNKDEGNHPSSGLPVHPVRVAGEAGMEHTLPVRFPRDVREGKQQKN